jgi:hypothetical protein
MKSPNTMLSAVSSEAVWDFLTKPVYVLGALLGLLLIVLLVKYLAYDLPKKRAALSAKKKATAAPTPNEEDARIAAAIAATLVAMDDERALIAAITAAVQAYLEAENGGKALPSGFRVVSFTRRGRGPWNR